MNKGNYAGEYLPKFFKVYLPDESGDDLELPISFNSYLPNPLPITVTVRSLYGNIWTTVFRKCTGHVEKFVMINGWKRIVKDEDLKGGEFLEFEFDGFRLFNFCIYGRTTCKKLRRSVQTKEVEDQSDGINDKSSVDIIVLDDDDNGEVNDDQDYGYKDKSSENILDDDDDTGHDVNDVQDYNEEVTSSEDIRVLDDDDDDDDADADNDDLSDVQNYVEEDTSSEDIIIIDDDDSDDNQDYGVDDENERGRGVKIEGKEKGSSGILKKSDNEDDRQYLDNDMNPFFRVNQNLHKNTDLHVPAKVVNDYGLHFPEFINLIDPLEKIYGKLKRKVKDQRIKGFVSIIRRNIVKSTDKVICELETDMNGLVREIKVHVIRG